MQLDLLDLLAPPPPIPRPVYVPPVTHPVMTRAYGKETIMHLGELEDDPYEIEVRGTPCLIVPTYGFKTYTVQPVGSLFWSESGFRSFTIGDWHVKGGLIFDGGPDDMVRLIEAHIDSKVSDGGCGGNLKKWWPSYVLSWRQDVSYWHGKPRTKYWSDCGPEEHAARFRALDDRMADALRRMIAEGIDPNDVEPPFFHKGKWPRFDMKAVA